MGIFKKVSNLVRSNVNAAVNAAEDPRKLIEQAVADIQEQIKGAQKKRLDVATLAKVTEKQVANLRASSQQWEQKATAALKQGNEELARAALTEKQSVDTLLAEAQTTLQSQRQMVEDISQSVTALEQHLQEAKHKRTELLTRLQQAEAQKRRAEAQATPPTKDHLGNTDAFDTFDRMVDKIEHSEAEAEAGRDLEALGRPSLETQQELKQLEGKGQVDDALEALKAKMKGG